MHDNGSRHSMDQAKADHVDDSSYKPQENEANGVWEAPRFEFELEMGRLETTRLVPASAFISASAHTNTLSRHAMAGIQVAGHDNDSVTASIVQQGSGQRTARYL